MSVDDAGGGARGRKPSLTTAHRVAADRIWGVSLNDEIPLGGSTSLNVLGTSGTGPVVVRVHRHHVTEERVVALQLAREGVAEAGLPVAPPRLGRGGERTVTLRATVMEVEQYVANDEKMDAIDRIRRSMPLFAHLHEALRELELPAAADDLQFANFVPAVGIEQATAAGTDRIRAIDGALTPLADRADELARRLADAQRALAPIEPQWCHGDFWDDNVLFRHDAVALVADFGFMNRRPRVDDLALTLYFTLLHLGLGALDDAAFSRAGELVRSYDAAARLALSEVELGALPLAIARQPLWSFAVWAAQLDDPAAVRAHLEDHEQALHLGELILDDLAHWPGRLRPPP